MTDVTILGVTFPDIDFLELETSDAFFDGLNEVQAAFARKTSGRDGMRALIIETSDATARWADSVLGEGAGEKLFKGRKSLSVATEILRGMTAAYTKAHTDYYNEVKEFTGSVDDFKASVSNLNREQRREQERQKHKNSRKKNNRKNSHYQTSPAPEPLHVVPEPYAPEPQPAPEQTE